MNVINRQILTGKIKTRFDPSLFGTKIGTIRETTFELEQQVLHGRLGRRRRDLADVQRNDDRLQLHDRRPEVEAARDDDAARG